MPGLHRIAATLVHDLQPAHAMLTINKLIPQARGLAPVLTKRAASVELDWNTRRTTCFSATDSLGRALGVVLPDGTPVHVGDVLVAEDGSLIVVRAASEPLMLVRHCSEHGSPFDLVRAAYALGRRNVPLQLSVDHLKLQLDPVQASLLLREMHLIFSEANDVFEPEADALEVGKHEPVVATPVHVHGPGCGHDHSHDHGHDHGHKH